MVFGIKSFNEMFARRVAGKWSRGTGERKIEAKEKRKVHSDEDGMVAAKGQEFPILFTSNTWSWAMLLLLITTALVWDKIPPWPDHATPFLGSSPPHSLEPDRL